MSDQEAGKLATVDDFEKASDTRYTKAEITFLGTVRIRSFRTSEYMRVAGKETQALFAQTGKKKLEAERMLLDAKVHKLALALVDGSGSNYMNNDRGRKALGAVDYAVLRAIEKKVDEHCGTEGEEFGDAPENLEEAEKN